MAYSWHFIGLQHSSWLPLSLPLSLPPPFLSHSYSFLPSLDILMFFSPSSLTLLIPPCLFDTARLSLFLSLPISTRFSSPPCSLSTIFSICLSSHSFPPSDFPLLPLIICLFPTPPLLCPLPSLILSLFYCKASGALQCTVECLMNLMSFTSLCNPSLSSSSSPHLSPSFLPSSRHSSTCLSDFHLLSFALFTSQEPTSWSHGIRAAQGTLEGEERK